MALGSSRIFIFITDGTDLAAGLSLLLLQHADDCLAVGEVGVAAAIASGFGGADACHLAGRCQQTGCVEVADQEVAFGIDVGTYVMGDRARVVAEADAAIEAGGTQPERAAIVSDRIRLPETDVVAPVGAVADRL